MYRPTIKRNPIVSTETLDPLSLKPLNTTIPAPKQTSYYNSVDFIRSRRKDIPTDGVKTDDNADLVNAGISMAGAVGSGIIDNFTKETSKDINGREYVTQDNLGAFGSGALKGASAGAAFGPVGAGIGAAVMGTAGLISNVMNNNEVERQKKQVLDTKIKSSAMEASNKYENDVAQGFKPQGQEYKTMFKRGGYINKYPDGGIVNPEYEVEGEEVVQGQGTNLEGQEDLASDMTKAIGPTHEGGGVQGEGGERVFSDRLNASESLIFALSALKIRVPKNATYATVAEKLGRYKSKFEDKLESHNSINQRTGKVMVDRIDSAIEATFQDQEMTKQMSSSTTKMKYGGKLPKYTKAGWLDEIVTPEQGINTAVYLANLNNADKQKTSFVPETASPTYMRNFDMLPSARYAIKQQSDALDKSIDNSSSNPQDRFARKMAIRGEAMDRTNQAVIAQQQSNNQTNNMNTSISNEYKSRVAENRNKYLEMKTTGENAILTNKQAATNAWLQGIMGNIASNRAYKVENEKMAIARMEGGRGTADRSRIPLWLGGSQDENNVPTDDELISYGKNYPTKKGEILKKRPDLKDKFAKGGYINVKHKSYSN